MMCIPPSVSLPASDSPSQRLAYDPTLLPSRSTRYRYPTVPEQHDPVQGLAADSADILHKAPCERHSEFRLPVEILDEIFSHATLSTLARLALVSHTFHELAARLLYRHIPFLSASHTTHLVETLASKPCLAAHTRTCEFGDMSFLDANRKGFPPSFLEQMRSTLHSMDRLTELTFLLKGPTSHVLLGAPFKLTKLTVSCDFDATFASWLTEQSSLRAAIFCGAFTEGVTLPTDALPSLRRVTASPPTLTCVVPGRLIRDVDLCLVHPWSLKREVLQTTIRVISSSKGPLDSLKIISHLAEPTDIVLSSLETIPIGLSSITKFALHAVSGSITNDILSGLPPILSRFTCLKSAYDALHIAASSRALAEAWHAHCSSLEHVTLPGATYVHDRNYGWISPRDLAELLETCRQPSLLQHCAAESRNQEVATSQGDTGCVLIRKFKSDFGMERNGSGASVVAVAA
ncbi:hypothetical protein EI94DRAFT_1720748 [Lactarius quietus]|nr:hypothetical protein EI94DRAFT_1720748 [Lactarius quietus]